MWRTLSWAAQLCDSFVTCALRRSRRCYNLGMCLICIEFDKSAMSVAEARRALGEMRADLDEEHVEALEAKLDEAANAQNAPKPSTP